MEMHAAWGKKPTACTYQSKITEINELMVIKKCMTLSLILMKQTEKGKQTNNY